MKKRGEVVTPDKSPVASRATLKDDKRFPDLSRTRGLIKRHDVALSQAVLDDRNER